MPVLARDFVFRCSLPAIVSWRPLGCQGQFEGPPRSDGKDRKVCRGRGCYQSNDAHPDEGLPQRPSSARRLSARSVRARANEVAGSLHWLCEDLQAKHAAYPGDSRPAKIAKIINRGTQHESIGEALDAIDGGVVRQFTAIPPSHRLTRGKSVLASAVVRRSGVREHFRGGIFWVRVGKGAKNSLRLYSRAWPGRLAQHRRILRLRCLASWTTSSRSSSTWSQCILPAVGGAG